MAAFHGFNQGASGLKSITFAAVDIASAGGEAAGVARRSGAWLLHANQTRPAPTISAAGAPNRNKAGNRFFPDVRTPWVGSVVCTSVRSWMTSSYESYRSAGS